MRIWEMCMLAAAACGMLILGSVYVRRKYKTGKKELVYKASATFMAVIPAVLMAVHEGSSEAVCIAAGVVCCMTADVLLELWFYAGAVVFAAAHICFITGFTLWQGPGGIMAGLWGLLFLAALAVFRRFISGLGMKSIPGAMYLLFLTAMCAMAVNILANNRGPAGAAAALGGIAFMVSDMVLIWNLLGKRQSRTRDRIVLGFYYSAVYLLAVCRYFPQ